MKSDRHLLAVKVIIESCQIFARKPKTNTSNFGLTAIEFIVDFAVITSAFSSAILLLEIFDLYPEIKADLIRAEESIKSNGEKIRYNGIETRKTIESLTAVFKEIDDTVSSVLKTIDDKINEELICQMLSNTPEP
jgi:hypothetical protein